jgi:hypothetical protein
VTSPIPPTHKNLYQAEEDNGEFVLVVPGNGNGADKYDNRNNEAEDGSNDCKPAAPPPLGGGICIGRHDNNDSNNDSDCKEMTTTTPTAMISEDSWDATMGGSNAPSALRRCPTSQL